MKLMKLDLSVSFPAELAETKWQRKWQQRNGETMRNPACYSNGIAQTSLES
jgi:hypothetical protein